MLCDKVDLKSTISDGQMSFPNRLPLNLQSPKSFFVKKQLNVNSGMVIA